MVTLQTSHIADRESAAVRPRRTFRSDVQGLRAVAVLAVVLLHAGVPGVSGGFVGVDVFFVLSGFLITGLLLREHEREARISLVGFYARRARRIIPASTLVLVLTVVASYYYLGFLRGGDIANDGRWTATFLANIHLALSGSNYLGAQELPSPLQNYWSLAVEEQFYLVWPAIFLIVAVVSRNSFRRNLLCLLLVLTAVSFVWSIMQTRTNGTWAYYSPLTRSCELSGGAVAAVIASTSQRLSRRAAAVAGWVGLAGIVWSAVLLDNTTPFPGWVVALPILSTFLVLVGGMTATALGPTALLSLPPLVWIGDISYSLYLWHWPVLTIAAQRDGTTLALGTNLLLVLMCVALAALTYYLVENPFRYARVLTQHAWRSVAVGLLLTGVAFGVATGEYYSHPRAHRAPNVIQI